MSNVVMEITEIDNECWQTDGSNSANISEKVSSGWNDTCMKATSLYNQVDFGLINSGFKQNYDQNVVEFIVEKNILSDVKDIVSQVKERFVCKELSLEVQRDNDFYLEIWVETSMDKSDVVDNYLAFLHEYWTAKSNEIEDLIIISVTPA